jgi:hypothetical protein
MINKKIFNTNLTLSQNKDGRYEFGNIKIDTYNNIPYIESVKIQGFNSENKIVSEPMAKHLLDGDYPLMLHLEKSLIISDEQYRQLKDKFEAILKVNKPLMNGTITDENHENIKILNEKLLDFEVFMKSIKIKELVKNNIALNSEKNEINLKINNNLKLIEQLQKDIKS